MKNYNSIAEAWKKSNKNNTKNAFANAEAMARCTMLGIWQGRTTDTSVKTNKRNRKK